MRGMTLARRSTGPATTTHKARAGKESQEQAF